MPVARRDLKEAAGKFGDADRHLTRRTGIAYEAVIRDERANTLKVQYLHGTNGCSAMEIAVRGGYKREGEDVLPWEICQSAGAERYSCYRRRKALGWVGRSQQRAYEAEFDPAKGPNMIGRLASWNRL